MTRGAASLNTRLLVVASIALIGFLGVTALALDAAFRESAAAAVRDRLQGHVYTLLAAAAMDQPGQLFVPDAMPEPRLSRPASGLYAQIDGRAFRWASRSMLGVDTELPHVMLGAGDTRFTGPEVLGEEELFVLAQGVVWEMDDGGEAAFTFSAAEDSDVYHEQIRKFRRALWVYLGAAAVLLLCVLAVALRWGLRPIRDLAREIGAVERGQQEDVAGAYPRELVGLADNINAFIRSERLQLERFRNALADLAHSLKTPLAVIRGAVDESTDRPARAIVDQVDRMDDIVAYQLKRASATGRRALSPPESVADSLAPVLRSLAKLYRDRAVAVDEAIDASVMFYGDRGDLLEVAGNLVENAFKWCEGRVRVTARQSGRPGDHRPGMELTVEDDGPGIAEDEVEQVLQRGVRGDERVQGHGIGLAVVGEIAAAYDGTVSIGKSALGGALIRVTFPGQSTLR